MKQTVHRGPAYNPVFAEHVSSTSFNLSLSRNMVMMMVTAKTGQWNLYRMAGVACASYTSTNALIQRGLVAAPDPQYPGIVELTEAGQYVYKLLEIAGQVQALEEEISKMQAEKAKS